jgi:DNA-binding response OmpR family regulator
VTALSSRPILVVDDDPKIVRLVRTYLERAGYRVTEAADGRSAISAIALEMPLLVVLDVMLPEVDGIAVLKAIRRTDRTPVIILSARGLVDDRIAGLAAGADDYLPKPTELAILLARIGGLLRRSSWSRPQPGAEPASEPYSFNGRTIDFTRQELTVGDRVLQLTLMEANLLRYLIEHEGKVVSRKAMLEQVWGLREDTDTRAIDNFVVRLRRYIEPEPSRPKHLVTVRGVGYRFNASPKS